MGFHAIRRIRREVAWDAVFRRCLRLRRSPTELAGHKLLALHKPTDFWARWLHLAGYEGPDLGDQTRYQTWGLMYETAANGFGVTIAVAALANKYLRDGRLVPCVEASVDTMVRYRIVYANPATRSRSGVRRLSAWLAEQMQQSSDDYLDILERIAPAAIQ